VRLQRGLFSLEAESQSELTASSITIESGGTQSEALTRLELTQSQITALVDIIQREDSLKVAKPGDVIKAFWSSPERTEESLERLEFYPAGKTRPLVFLPGGPQKFSLYNTYASPIVVYQVYKGLIKDNFWTAAVESGLSPKVINGFADLLSSQIDFLTDIRTGDSFEILFQERRRDGELLDDPVLQLINMVNQDREIQFYRFTFPSGEHDFFDASFQSIRKNFFVSPLQYTRVSSQFSTARTHPIFKIVRPHLGVDYSAPSGTPVSSVAKGTVKFRGRRGGYGNLVVIQHEGGYETMYGHLSRFADGLAENGEVAQGELIGYVGMTGTATGPHLDFRLKKGDEFVDPQKELSKQQGETLAQEFRQAFSDLITTLQQIRISLEP
jgi:murein DD-endopeptidase MepM/ murein hydrolase activator NlpD